MATVSFYLNGTRIIHPARTVPAYMLQACQARGIDRRDMAAIGSRIIESEEARETFEELTGLEVVRHD